jgi:hypothetical protein
MFPKGFFRSKPKPKRWSERPKMARIRRKNAAKNAGYKKFWLNL